MIQILVAFLIFTFFAIGGLIVDLGFARLTQRQMTNASDAASLEGLRLMDATSDENRRWSSRAMLSAHYDDDFGVTASDARRYGAGPAVAVVGGRTSMDANAQVVVDEANPVFEPTLELNLLNAREGDMVAGRFDPADEAHLESASYARSDFDVSGTQPGWRAFLVRLRRTDGSRALDAQPGVSSRGPALPYIFGRGSLIGAKARTEGIVVRATAIAAARRATMVGPEDLARGITGATPLLLDLQFWNGLSSNSSTYLRFGRDGVMPGGGGRTHPPGGPPMPNPDRPPEGPFGGPPIIPPGQITGSTGEPRGVFATREGEDRQSWSIGDQVWPRANLSVDEALRLLGNPHRRGFQPRVIYVPIYDGVIDWDGRPGNSNPPWLPPVVNVPKGDGPARLIGFGAVVLLDAERLVDWDDDWDDDWGDDWDDWDDDDDGAWIRIRKLGSFVAPLNVSAISTPGLADTFADSILARHRQVDSPLRGAALVR